MNKSKWLSLVVLAAVSMVSVGSSAPVEAQDRGNATRAASAGVSERGTAKRAEPIRVQQARRAETPQPRGQVDKARAQRDGRQGRAAR